MLLVGISVFVSAWAGESGAPIYKGWNLVYGFISPDQLNDQSFDKSHIKAIYAFIPTTQKYVRLFPNGENLEDLEDSGTIDDDEILQMALFIYSDKTVEGELNGMAHGTEYWLYDTPNPYTERTMYKGWNFVGITPDLIGNSLNDLKGSCDIEKAYLFDAQQQQWGTIFNLLDDKNIIKNEAGVGSGFIIKVTNNCKLGTSSGGNIPSVPTLP